MDNNNIDSRIINVTSGSFLSACRGILAIVVCLAHTWQKILSPQYGSYGWEHAVFGISARISVDFFYVISGWAIFYSLWKNKVQNEFNFKYSDWIINRVSRIFPPICLFIFLDAVIFIIIRIFDLDGVNSIYGITPDIYYFRPHQTIIAILTLGFFGNLGGAVNGPLWSLALELQMYFISSICFYAFYRNRFLFIGLLVFAFARATLDANNLLAYSSFSFGFFASLITLNWIKRPNYAAILRFISYTVISSSTTILFFEYSENHQYLDMLANWNSVFVQIFAAFGFSLYLISGPKLGINIIEKAGNFSYTLYATHFPILIFISYFVYRNPIAHNSWIGMLISYVTAAAFCVIIAASSARYVERPSYFKIIIQRYLKKYWNVPV